MLNEFEITQQAIKPFSQNYPSNVENPQNFSDADDDVSFFNFFDHLIQQAVYQQTSDIHIEPRATDYRIRFRLHGLLNEFCIINKKKAIRLITRIKIISNLNIAETRLPQDGYLLLEDRQRLECRISICPTLHGEKMVLRLNQNKKKRLLIEQLGLLPAQQNLLKQHLSFPQGLILVTGPTGSGKTMTLYSILEYLNLQARNITTIEDPIESDIENINQIQINTQIGLDFNNILRAILRQDPDVIMVGEIRDSSTANLVMQASLTGHLVLSTLHNHQAIDAIKRLNALGVDLEHYSQAISLIIAQRLVRKLCDHCKIENSPGSYQAAGCSACKEGYNGRIGIFEILPYSSLKINCHNQTDFYQYITKAIAKEKWIGLAKAGMAKVISGETTNDEIIRVLGNAK